MSWWQVKLAQGFPGSSADKESTCSAGEPSWIPVSGRSPSRRDRLAILVFIGFPGGSDSKESSCKPGDLCSIPGLGRSRGKRNGDPFQYSCLENPHGQRSLVDYRPWGLKESDTTEQLSFHFSHFKSFNLGRHIGLSAYCHICEKYYGLGIRPYL